MKKLIDFCRVIQTVSAVIAAIMIILLSTAYEPTVNRFIIMGFIFLVSVIIAAFMTLIIDVEKNFIDRKQAAKEKTEDDEDDLPEVEVKAEIPDAMKRSAKAVYCTYSKDGRCRLYQYERRFDERG